MPTRLSAAAGLANVLGRMAVDIAAGVVALRPERQRYYEDHF